MDRVVERLKTEFRSEDARYAYADSVANAFLTAQIKALREERGLTQEKLAELVGTKQSGISRWQNTGYSSCKVETLRKFAKGLGVRLRITFEEFGSLPADIAGFTKERLAPRKFEDDPAFKEEAVDELELETAVAAVGDNNFLVFLAPPHPGDLALKSLGFMPGVPYYEWGASDVAPVAPGGWEDRLKRAEQIMALGATGLDGITLQNAGTRSGTRQLAVKPTKRKRDAKHRKPGRPYIVPQRAA